MHGRGGGPCGGANVIALYPENGVLSGAPYGYRYIRKTDDAPASYQVIDAEARVVQRVHEMYRTSRA
jgi:hypothetical protein